MSKIIPFKVNSMTKKKAIEILTIQKNKIDDPSHYNDENWVFQTSSYAKDFFGENSIEFITISQFTFSVIRLDWYDDENVRELFQQKRTFAKVFIDNCIETINNKGLYVPPKNNFITRMSEGWAIFYTGIVLVSWGGVCFSFGLFFSQNKIDADKVSKQNKIDSLLRVTQSFIINANKPTNDNTTKGIYGKPNKQK